MSQNGLNRFAICAQGVKIRCQAAAEGMPAVPVRERHIPLDVAGKLLIDELPDLFPRVLHEEVLRQMLATAVAEIA